jgi:hypothetical protein
LNYGIIKATDDDRILVFDCNDNKFYRHWVTVGRGAEFQIPNVRPRLTSQIVSIHVGQYSVSVPKSGGGKLKLKLGWKVVGGRFWGWYTKLYILGVEAGLVGAKAQKGSDAVAVGDETLG